MLNVEALFRDHHHQALIPSFRLFKPRNLSLAARRTLIPGLHQHYIHYSNTVNRLSLTDAAGRELNCLSFGSINNHLGIFSEPYLSIPSIRTDHENMTPTLDPPKSSLTEQLNSPPKASLQILGTHFSNEQIKVIGFDLWIDCSKIAGIRSGKFLMNSESDCQSWNYSANQDNCNFEEILDGWLNDRLGSSTDGRSYAFLAQYLLLC